MVFIGDIQRPHLCKVRMHDGGVYLHGTYIQLARAVEEQQFCERRCMA